jgi:DNA-binding beta-propeller fold protein YncE
MAFLHAAAAVAEGAAVGETKDSSVSAALHDPLRRVGVLGGRPGLRRSLGSVYAGCVTRFLGGFCGVRSRTVPTLEWDAFSDSGGMAVTRDGAALLVTERERSHCLYVFDVTTGKALRTMGGKGTAPLQFFKPHRVCITDDDVVFVADSGNNRIQVLTPQLGFYGFVGVGQLLAPFGVCANEHVIVVSNTNCISVFQRSDGAFVRRFGAGTLLGPLGLCFIGKTGQIAVANSGTDCVAVFTLEGKFIRYIKHDKLVAPADVASSAAGELVVGAFGSKVFVYSASDEMLHDFGDCFFGRVAIHGGAIFVQSCKGLTTVFT